VPDPLDADRLDAIAAEATDADLTLLRAERDAALASPEGVVTLTDEEAGAPTAAGAGLTRPTI